MQLRPYQIAAVNQLRQGFKHHKRQLLCLPTGGGKTVVFSEIASKAAEKGKRVAIITDRIELLQQAGNTLFHHGLKPFYMTAGSQAPYASQIVIGMVQTLYNRIKKGWTWKPDLLIIDEAHRGNFSKIMDAWPNVMTIGATATPVGKHLYHYYTNIIDPVQIKQLVDDGYLCTYRPIQVVQDLSGLKVKNGEFTNESLSGYYREPKRFGEVIKHYREHAEGSKAIVFNCSIEHSEETAREFQAAGYTSASVTSKTHPDERRRILAAFRDGYIQVLNNCGILTTGYDEPSIETVIMNRATMSLPLWLQCCGRGSRTHPGKEQFTVIDLGNNHDRLGWWDDLRHWRLEEPKQKRNTEGTPPHKSCPSCTAIVLASAKVCPHCNTPFPDGVGMDGVGVELTRGAPVYLKGRKITDLSIPDLINYQKAKGYRTSWVWRICRSRGEAALREYAKLAGYAPGWVRHQIQMTTPADHVYDVVIQ